MMVSGRIWGREIASTQGGADHHGMPQKQEAFPGFHLSFSVALGGGSIGELDSNPFLIRNYHVYMFHSAAGFTKRNGHGRSDYPMVGEGNL